MKKKKMIQTALWEEETVHPQWDEIPSEKRNEITMILVEIFNRLDISDLNNYKKETDDEYEN